MSAKAISRRRALTLGGAGSVAAAAGLATPALAQSAIIWKMVTSWPKDLPGPGASARRIAEAISKLSDGRLKVELFAAGELVPALEVFDAVAGGTAQIGHSASFFWQGKMAAAPFFTAVPFGFTPLEHMCWIERGGGQQVWDALYEPFGVLPLMGGNTGFQMGGWYKREINGLEDIKGLKIRMPGLGGEVMRRLGATPVSLPPSEILTGLQSGVIDAAEFLGPSSDLAMGFHQATKLYYGPGWHEPNGTGEALLNASAFNALPEDLKGIVIHAIRAENALGLAEGEWMNAVQLGTLTDKLGVKLMQFPDDVLEAARRTSDEVLAGFADKGGADAEVYRSFAKARETMTPWSRANEVTFLNARV
ncbi:TRAP-type mannitol/chloroaromatic compound transport system substrate-binding protein [Breoghania corrubedonensis]|uniref:TRAP-type mannitol/chloroaromatic compound transport system substrate-binding protein n=1 Tax=Breoghania corrubedonensis TaxID=665038 RepID=A0A2T5V4Q5_9HYPH|nr:TRAP transporter substrate-binding protein [Breoghania corrubedonensis]PTW58726.1 TRAP-type mannitol/chloroaromatic compound transport system substrate-binding protein [Breoghania corrubedonensis]